MKKNIVSTLVAFLLASNVNAQNNNIPERDPRLPRDFYESMGRFIKYMEVAAVAEIMEINDAAPDFPFGFLKVRVVNPIFGCINGQEFMIEKNNTKPLSPNVNHMVWYYSYELINEFYPTNLTKRIMFFGRVNERQFNESAYWTPKDWNQPPQPDIIISSEKPVKMGFTGSWWYEDYDNGIPYAHFTNLVRAARVERNWTNFYHIVRDSMTTTASPMTWWSSHADINNLLDKSTKKQFEFMENDPLFPKALRERVEFYKKPGNMRYKENENVESHQIRIQAKIKSLIDNGPPKDPNVSNFDHFQFLLRLEQEKGQDSIFEKTMDD